MTDQPDPLEGFTESFFSHASISHPVFRVGHGPAVVLIHEVPGIHPGVVDLARRLVNRGYTVYLPSLFGRPGGEAGKGIARTIAKICVSRGFRILASRTSPATGWLRALAAQAHAECGGAGVGAIGMCMTGSFARHPGQRAQRPDGEPGGPARPPYASGARAHDRIPRRAAAPRRHRRQLNRRRSARTANRGPRTADLGRRSG